MHIDKTILNRNIWYEDSEGNVKTFDGVPDKSEVIGMTYHTKWPLEITEHIGRVTPEGTYKHLGDINTHISGGNEKTILAMANSGDYTLGEAIMLWANACERCMNVLEFKYSGGVDGYAEHSNEWKRCGTECEFCREEDK